MERLWSYLGGFVKVTRAMSKSHRQLTLHCGLKYFKEDKLANLGNALIVRHNNAVNLRDASIAHLGGSMTDQQAANYRHEFESHVRHQQNPATVHNTLTELMKFYFAAIDYFDLK
ncbi:unnamed protein product [Absidia cylindrospora]